MRKRKLDLRTRGKIDVYSYDSINISREENEYFFEIGNDLTSDVAEAVSILMRRVDYDDFVWDIKIKNIITENITPEKALFWLTGGYEEWKILDNYNKPWVECYLDFQEEFGYIIANIMKKSKNLREVRDNFIKHLNLTTLYDFALSKDMIK
jgi:hypothetical protein